MIWIFEFKTSHVYYFPEKVSGTREFRTSSQQIWWRDRWKNAFEVYISLNIVFVYVHIKLH